MSIRDNFWPMAVGPNPALHVQGYVDSICTGIMMVCCVIILIGGRAALDAGADRQGFHAGTGG